MYCGKIDRMPGNPPTPIETAVTPVLTEIIAANADPIMALMNGKPYLIFTPNIAGSVTPK